MTTTPTAGDQDPQRAALLTPAAVEMLSDLDADGVDFTVLGVAAHLALRIARGHRMTPETLGEELGDDVDALDELLDTGHVVPADDGVLQLARLDEAPTAPDNDATRNGQAGQGGVGR